METLHAKGTLGLDLCLATLQPCRRSGLLKSRVSGEKPAMVLSTRVSDYMLSKPVLVKPDTDLYKAIHEILVNRISGVTVVDETGRPIGMLSELDCLHGILAGTYHQSVGGKVKDYMTTGPIECVGPNDDILLVAKAMIERKRRRLPVVNAEGVLVGQVTCRGLLKALKDFGVPEDPAERP